MFDNQRSFLSRSSSWLRVWDEWGSSAFLQCVQLGCLCRCEAWGKMCVCVCSGCVLLAFACWWGFSTWHQELVTCQDGMIKGPFKTWLFCVLGTPSSLCQTCWGGCAGWEAEVLRTTAWSCSGLQMFSCEIVSEGRSDKLQGFLCLYLVLLAGANIQDQGSLRALCF